MVLGGGHYRFLQTTDIPEVWGIPTEFGPSTVCQILGELKWEVNNRPTPPGGS